MSGRRRLIFFPGPPSAVTVGSFNISLEQPLKTGESRVDLRYTSCWCWVPAIVPVRVRAHEGVAAVAGKHGQSQPATSMRQPEAAFQRAEAEVEPRLAVGLACCPALPVNGGLRNGQRQRALELAPRGKIVTRLSFNYFTVVCLISGKWLVLRLTSTTRTFLIWPV